MNQDCSLELRDEVLAAISAKTPLNITGGNTKHFYGRPAQGRVVKVSSHAGIINYEPTELVLTARCGTSLAALETLLAEQGQMLPFEPPHFGAQATLGGAIASGLSGPRRLFSGSVRDAVLGVRIINGRGEVLKFGGEVMKNVAGFDIARLMVGALGTLGILLDISVKVQPKPEIETTLSYVMSAGDALARMIALTNRNLPLSAACYDGHSLKLRLAGVESGLAAVRKQLGGNSMPSAEAACFWQDWREHRLPFFQDATPLWRLSLPAATPLVPSSSVSILDWGGALRWLKTSVSDDAIQTEACCLGGHATRFRAAQGGLFQPLPPALETLHKKLKNAFDPVGIFNVGRMYPGW